MQLGGASVPNKDEVVAPVDASPKLVFTPSDLAAFVTVNEARASVGLPPVSDGGLTIIEYQGRNASAIAKVESAKLGETIKQKET